MTHILTALGFLWLAWIWVVSAQATIDLLRGRMGSPRAPNYVGAIFFVLITGVTGVAAYKRMIG